MKQLTWMVLGSVALWVGCGTESPEDGPVPTPLPNGICAVEHVETEGDNRLVVCDELYSEAPFVHLPDGPGWVFAAIETTVEDGARKCLS